MSEDNTPDPALAYEPIEVAVVHEHRILVRCPYNTRFTVGAKVLGGQWQRHDRLWVFPGENERWVRMLCDDWFGTDGSSPPDLVDVHITFNEAQSQRGGEVTVFGRVVANIAYGRPAKIRLGEGVTFVRGHASIESEGIGQRTVVAAGSVVRMVAVPRALAEEQAPPGIEVSIIERPTPKQYGARQDDDGREMTHAAEYTDPASKDG
jgi:hypothetical protein